MPRFTSPRANKSPIKSPPLRQPGQSLSEKLGDVLTDRWMPWCMAVLIIWVTAGTEWLRVWTRSIPSVGTSVVLTVIAVLLSLLAGYKIWLLLPMIRAIRLGMQGERVVGQFLDEHCRERGYKVFHDILGDRFNIDHVLIGPGGVFTLDTKTISKPAVGEPVVIYDGKVVIVDGHTPDRDPIAQAKAAADHVCNVLVELTGRQRRDIFVRPVVLYPGWYIEGKSSGCEVWVLNPKALVSFLDHESRKLSKEDIALFASRLASHVRHSCESTAAGSN